MNFEERLAWLEARYESLISRKNEPVEGNGIYERYRYPVLTGDHAPVFWRYDLNRDTNPYLMERFGISEDNIIDMMLFAVGTCGRCGQEIIFRYGRERGRSERFPFLGPSCHYA